MADKPLPLHTVYTWEVRTVPLEKAKATLDELTNGSYEVISVNPVLFESTNSIHMVIAARQSDDVMRSLSVQKNARELIANKTTLNGKVPFTGSYLSVCGHMKEVRLIKSDEFTRCTMCPQCDWYAVKLDLLG
jgi:hypothetical protein